MKATKVPFRERGAEDRSRVLDRASGDRFEAAYDRFPLSFLKRAPDALRFQPVKHGWKHHRAANRLVTDYESSQACRQPKYR